jgi:hypothetical protein
MAISKPNGYAELLKLQKQYCTDHNQNYFNHWTDALRKYTRLNRHSLIDIAVDAANISLTISNDPSTLSDPLVMSAIRDTVPTFDFDNPLTGQALEGAINTAKGKYFEYLVVEKLNNGERVGDVVLPEGYTAKVAESLTQPGWDIQILDQSLVNSEYLQLKATDSAAYIKEALDRYPDITILTTDEALDAQSDNYLILDSDISNSTLEQTVRGALESSDAAIGDAFIDAFNPLLSIAFILGTEGLKVSVSKKDMGQAMLSLSHRTTRTLLSQSMGGLIYAAGGGWLAIPATILTGGIYERLAELYETSVVMERAKDMLTLLRIEQQELGRQKMILNRT